MKRKNIAAVCILKAKLRVKRNYLKLELTFSSNLIFLATLFSAFTASNFRFLRALSFSSLAVSNSASSSLRSGYFLERRGSVAWNQ